MRKHTKQTIGLDLGDRWSRFCVVDRELRKVQEDRVATTPEAVRAWLSRVPRSRIALETGTHSPWVSRLLEELGHEVIVANARQLQLISKSHTKNDRLDAERLARWAAMDPEVLAPIRHRSAAVQADLEVVRARKMMVEARTKLVQHVRGAVKSWGARLPACSTHGFSARVREAIPEALRPALGWVLPAIDDLSRQIRALDREVERLSRERYPETERLQQVSGVGPLVSLVFVLTLEDPRRFAKSRKVGSYVGLRPRQRESGDQAPQLPITKAGDVYLRVLLVQAAQYILGPFGKDSDLRRYGEAIAARGGKNAKKRAVVAVARKLAVMLHRLWVSGEPYDPLRSTHRREAQAPTVTA